VEISFDYWESFSDLDYSLFQDWLELVQGFIDHDGFNYTTHMSFDSDKVYAKSLDQLLVLFARYKIDPQHLFKLKTEKNKYWFEENKEKLCANKKEVTEKERFFTVWCYQVPFYFSDDKSLFFERLKTIAFVVEVVGHRNYILLRCDRKAISVPDLHKLSSLFRRYKISFDSMLYHLDRGQQSKFNAYRHGHSVCVYPAKEGLD
jgi:hypothetical protein